MAANSTPDAVLDDLAERVGRIATAHMLTVAASKRGRLEEKMNLAIAGYLGSAEVFLAARDFFEAEEFAAFVNTLRSRVALHEEKAV
jgi:hypothetical protein